MYLRNHSYHFYSVEYCLTLTFHNSGRISGYLILSLEPDAPNFPLYGCYSEYDGLAKFSFYVDWSFLGEKNWGFTCFSGGLVNDDTITLDWILIEYRNNEDYTIVGSDYLFSNMHKNDRKKIQQKIKPFPINRKFLIEVNKKVPNILSAAN